MTKFESFPPPHPALEIIAGGLSEPDKVETVEITTLGRTFTLPAEQLVGTTADDVRFVLQRFLILGDRLDRVYQARLNRINDRLSKPIFLRLMIKSIDQLQLTEDHLRLKFEDPTTKTMVSAAYIFRKLFPDRPTNLSSLEERIAIAQKLFGEATVSITLEKNHAIAAE